MKLPLWAKDKNGKWQVLPLDAMIVPPDGRIVITDNDMIRNDRVWSAYNASPDKFRYTPGIDAYVLKTDDE